MAQWHVQTGGQQYGPVSQDELISWIRQGRVNRGDQVWSDGMEGWAPAGSVPELLDAFASSPPANTPPLPQQPYAHSGLAPHRGVMILIFGILGLTACAIFGIIAWVMGNTDLREIDEGRMDPSGRGMVQAGRICGIIATCLLLVVLAIWLIFGIFAGGAALLASCRA